MAIKDVLLRIFYSTSFTLAFLVLLAFCCVTPADTLYQSYKRHRLVDIFIITGAYVLTGLIAIFLYSSRVYTNRSVLRDIPKTFLPIEKDDLPKRRLWVLIQDRLARSAVALYHASPRARRIEVEHPTAGERILLVTKQIKRRDHQLRHYHHENKDKDQYQPLAQQQPHLSEHEEKLLEPKWGDVQHPGWRSPAAKDMPGLEYVDVVNQLADLVEANAVSLSASTDDDEEDEAEQQQEQEQESKGKNTASDKQAVIDLVTRPEHFGMRQYIDRLTQLGVVSDDDSTATESFVRAYERARFAATPLSTREFDDLMRRFAELLRNMKPLDPAVLLLSDDDDDDDDDDGDGDGEEDGKGNGDKGLFLSPSLPSLSRRHLPPSHISEDSAAPSISEDERERERERDQEREREQQRQRQRDQDQDLANGNSSSSSSSSSKNNLVRPTTAQQKNPAGRQPRKRSHGYYFSTGATGAAGPPRRPSRRLLSSQVRQQQENTAHSPPSPPRSASQSTTSQRSNTGSVVRLKLRGRRKSGDDNDDEEGDDNNDNDNDDARGDAWLPYTIEVGGRK